MQDLPETDITYPTEESTAVFTEESTEMNSGGPNSFSMYFETCVKNEDGSHAFACYIPKKARKH